MSEAGVEHEVERREGCIRGHRGQEAPVQAPQALIASDGGQSRQRALLQGCTGQQCCRQTQVWAWALHKGCIWCWQEWWAFNASCASACGQFWP